jgi:hypothetical protein
VAALSAALDELEAAQEALGEAQAQVRGVKQCGKGVNWCRREI